jgi:uncharacterized protein YcaQ
MKTHSIEITNAQARHFLLAHQGLWPPRKLTGKNGIIEYIHHVGSIQFDPLNIIGYNPDLVLQARIKNYREKDLRELLYKDRKLLDGWDKNMCIYAVEDWPYFSRHRERSYKRLSDPSRPANKIVPHLRKTLKEKGPLSSIDLDYKEIVDWAWAPTKIGRAALESMYFWGELIVYNKNGVRKYYDFAKKHIPPEILAMPDPNVTREQYFEWHVKRRIGGIGLLWDKSGDAWLGIHGLKSNERTEAISKLLKGKEILPVKIENINFQFYIRKEEEDLLRSIQNGYKPKPKASIIAPLDNLMWDRKLIKKIFDFDYVWEVYKIPSERKYGYYVLPVLYGDRFIARFDAGWDKKTNNLLIKNWWWEQDITATSAIQKAISECFYQFLEFIGADGMKVCKEKSIDRELKWLQESANC